MITNYGGKLSACIKACREGGRVRAAFMKREARERELRSESLIGYDLKNLLKTRTFSLPFCFIFFKSKKTKSSSRPFLMNHVFHEVPSLFAAPNKFTLLPEARKSECTFSEQHKVTM